MKFYRAFQQQEVNKWIYSPVKKCYFVQVFSSVSETEKRKKHPSFFFQQIVYNFVNFSSM